jgi:putative oxidoreductase
MIRDIALLAARLAVGGGMAAHGAQKALGLFDGPGSEKAAAMMHGLGFRPGETYAPLASWNEIASGFMIALGVGGPIGPALLISNMMVAATSVHWKNGFFAQKNGIEVTVLYSAAALAFAATDFGGISIDAVLGSRKPLRDPYFTTLAIAGGLAGAIVVLTRRDTTPEGPATPTFRGKNSPLPDENAAPSAN